MRPRQDPVVDPAAIVGVGALGPGFFGRPTVRVARALLGTLLVRDDGAGRLCAARLVETEAYVAGDPASHAFRGRTERNRSMFGRPGTLYVYRIHQVHCANVVTLPGQAVLLRAAEPVVGLSTSLSGPGRLARAFGLSRADDGADLACSGPLRLLARRQRVGEIVAGPRVGVSRARREPLRFALRGSPAVSYPRPWRRHRA